MWSVSNHAGDAATRPSVPIRSVLSPRTSVRPPQAPARRIPQLAGYARMAPTQSASASAPLHASVASMGSAGVPHSPTANRPWSRVSGRSPWVSTQFRRRMPNRPRLQATARSAKSTARVRLRIVSVGTADLLDRDVTCAEGPAQLVDGLQALEPARAGEDVDVHGAGLRPGVQGGVRLAQDEDAGEACSGKY